MFAPLYFYVATFKSISKFYGFGFLKFNQISARYFLPRYARSRERTRWILQSVKKHPKNKSAITGRIIFRLCEAGFKF